MRCLALAAAAAAALLIAGAAAATAGTSPPAAAAASAPAWPACGRWDLPFLDPIRSQCPLLSIEPCPPREVSGETIDKVLTLGRRRTSYSILFYATRCPFSRKFRPIFDALSTMFPQIQHFSVEESSAMPSLFSRYGIHGFPTILLANETMMIRYRGSKDLGSLVDFYKETTGLDPVAYVDVDQQGSSGNMRSLLPGDQSLRELVKNEPFMVLAVLFIFLKVTARFIPVVLSRWRAFWVLRAHNLNLGIFGGSSQLLGRALTVLDVKRLWSKFRLSNKTRDLRKGASNARAWASSFASVSLGEPAPPRQP